MPDTAEILLARIDERLTLLGKSRYWLSKQVTEGKHAGVITDLARKRHIPAEARLRAIAEKLKTTTDWLLARTDSPVQPLSEVSGFNDVRLGYRGPFEPAGPRIPVRGTGHCTDLEINENGETVFVEQALFEPDAAVAWVERPAALLGAVEAYAIHYRGSSMEPALYQGQVGVADPRRVARPGDNVIVQLNDGQSHTVVTVLVKQLVRETSRYVELEQFNPRFVFRVPRERVERLHKLLTVGDLLGGR